MKKKTFYTEPAPVLDPTIPCLGRDKPYTGTEPEFQKSSAGVIAVYGLDLAFHCPNETRGRKSKPGEAKTAADINRMMLAGQGVRPGVTDWCIPHPTAFGHPGAFIELKVKKGTLSHDQIRYMNKAKSFGYYVAAIWNLDEFEAVVKTLWPRRNSFSMLASAGTVHTAPGIVQADGAIGYGTGFSSAGNTPLFPEQKHVPFYPEPDTESILAILKQKYAADTKQGQRIRQIEAVASAVTEIAEALKQSDADAIENVITGLDSALRQIQSQATEFKSEGRTEPWIWKDFDEAFPEFVTAGDCIPDLLPNIPFQPCHGLPVDRVVIEIRGEFVNEAGEINGPELAKAIGMSGDWEGSYENDLKMLQEQNPGFVISIDTGYSNPHPDPESLCIDWTSVTVIDFADPAHVAIAKTLTSTSIVRVLNNPFVVGQEVPLEFDDMYASYDYATVPFWLDAVDLLVYGHRGNPIPDQEVCDKLTRQYLTHLRMKSVWAP